MDLVKEANQKDHQGVGAIITCPQRDWFYLQQKDENYPIEKWQLAYSLWGGAIETQDNSIEDALFRELEEELNWPFEKKAIHVGRFQVESDATFPIEVFEILLPYATLIEFANECEPQEGYGNLTPEDRLFEQQWVWDLDTVMRKYLEK